MNRSRRPFQTILLLLVAMTLQGCIGFSGPNGIRKAIAQSQDVRLEKEFGVDVGPLTIAFANLVAAPFVPMTADGISWVSVGRYTIKPHHDGSINTFSLDYLELTGWETFVRVREEGQNIKVMCNTNGDHLKKLLAIIQEGNKLTIAKIEGDFEKIIENALNSNLLEDLDFTDGNFGEAFGKDFGRDFGKNFGRGVEVDLDVGVQIETSDGETVHLRLHPATQTLEIETSDKQSSYSIPY